MHATLALVFLASLVTGAPFTYTSGVERGPQLTRILPGNIEHVRSMEKTDKSLLWNPTMVTTLPKERFVLINPSVNVLPKEEFTTESVEGKQQFLMANPVIRSKGESKFFYPVIRANPTQSGWLSVKPEHTEGLFHFSGVKSDAMQQSQQLEGRKYGTETYSKKSGVRKFEAKPGYMEYVKADAMQQSQQLEATKYGKEEFINPRSGRAGWLRVEPTKTEGIFKMDAMQQGQQLEGRRFVDVRGIEYIPSRSGWLRVEPTKTEGIFKSDQMPIELTEFVPVSQKWRTLNPQSNVVLPIRLDAMQQHHQLGLEAGQQGQQLE